MGFLPTPSIWCQVKQKIKFSQPWKVEFEALSHLEKGIAKMKQICSVADISVQKKV
jgi:hypothetical protein